MEDKHISQFWLLLRKNLSDFVCLGVIRADPKRLLEFVFRHGVVVGFFVGHAEMVVLDELTSCAKAEGGPTVLLLSVTIVLAVLIRSVGVALVAGLGTWIATSLLSVPTVGWRRLRKFLLPLVLGLAAQLRETSLSG